ncbi:MAG TPA: class I SAM-dependent methyltransferase [Gemmatales bacterium]|nr:class I SAM-dependent methyltransferase [Gemmatales bacterium]
MSAQPTPLNAIHLHEPRLNLLRLRQGAEDDQADEPPDILPLRQDPAREWAMLESLSPFCRFEAEPYSLQWFLSVEHERYGRHGSWLRDLLGFTKHAGETVLCLGRSLGTDAIQFARHGAQVILCQPVAADLALARRNFQQRRLSAAFIPAAGERLPLASESVDVAILTSSLLAELRPAACVAEVLRVLRPGGKLLAVLPAERSALWGWLRRGPELPAPQRAAPRRARQLFDGLLHARVKQRHLRRRNIIWPARWLPRSWLERLVGDFLLFKGFKPIHTAAPRLAA